MLCFIVLSLLAQSAGAVGELVEIRGNRVLSDGQVRALLGDVSGDAVDAERQRALGRLQESYIQRGYLFAQIRIEDIDGGVVVHVDEGDIPHFGLVRITGAERFSGRSVRQMLHAERGDRFTAAGLQQGINDVLERYDRAGFPFAQIWVDSLQLDRATGLVRMSLSVVEGGAKNLTAIEVEGLTETREELVVKLSGLHVGGRYDGRKLQESYLRLTSTGIFDDVAYPTVRLSPDGDGVEALLRVVEPQQRHNFSGAFGYADRETDQDRVLSGYVQLNLNNMGGTLRDFGLFWRNDGAGRNETKIDFQQRFFLGRRMSMGLSLEQVGLDTLYTWQSVGLQSAVPLGRILGGFLSVDIGAHGDRNTFSTGNVSKSLRWRLRGGYTFVLGDKQRGASLEVMNRIAYAQKELNQRGGDPPTEVKQTIIELGGQAVTLMTSNIHLVTRLNYRSLESPEALVPLSEQYYVGGAATLRGYRENQFHGRRVAWGQLELLLGRSRFENGYLFLDGGYVLQESLQPDSTVAVVDTYRAGYGFGLRTQSRAGNIDISFGVGEEMSLRQTKVHVILNRRF